MEQKQIINVSEAPKERIILVFAGFCLFFVLIFLKAFYIQIIASGKLIAYADTQLVREVEIQPARGNIYDRNFSPLAINIPAWSVAVIPKYVKNKSATYRLLATIVPGVSTSSIKEKIKKRTYFTWIERQIRLTEQQVDTLKATEGVVVESEPKRFYPNKELLSQTLGIVGSNNKGLAGLEFAYDKMLTGSPKIVRYLKDAKGRPSRFEDTPVDSKADDLVTSIDKELQGAVEDYLKEAVTKHVALMAGAAVMDVKTGEILAIANYPSYDPNKWKNAHEDLRKLSFISEPFEPGSVFKAITVAAALEHRTATPNTKYYCENGRFQVNNHIINEAGAHKYEWLTVADILKLSSNIGTTKIAFDLGFSRFSETLKNFGIGEKTGIQIPGESRGILTDSEKVSDISLSNMSFGQGVAVTGIQMLAAYSAIANEGMMARPTILRRDEASPDETRIISKETAASLKKMLEQVVISGTGRNAKMKLFRIAGKTGTAQKSVPGVGYEGYIPSFIGFPLDVERPFVVFVYVDSPTKGGHYGDVIAGPVFRKITEFLLYKNSEYDNIQIEDKVSRENLARVDLPDKILARIESPDKVPDFMGLDKASSRELAEKLGLKLEHEGMGIVEKQIPGPGKPLNAEKIVRLFHAPPTL